MTIAENVCDGRARKKFAVLETQRGVEVTEMGRFAKALQENQDGNCKEQQDTIEYMKKKRSGGSELLNKFKRNEHELMQERAQHSACESEMSYRTV